MKDVNGTGGNGTAAGLPWMGRVPADYVFSALPPTAQRILVAAQHVLAREGWRGLTLRRIAAEAGEHKSLIIYHFESKAGLLEALVDSLWHDVDVELVEHVERLPADSRERVEALLDAQRSLSLQTQQYQMYWDLVPHLVRDRATRERMAALNESYRDLGERCLSPLGLPAAEARPLASFLLAVLDGMGVLVHLVPDLDDAGAYRLLKDVLGVGAGGTPGGCRAGAAKGRPAGDSRARSRDGGDMGGCPDAWSADGDRSPVDELSPAARKLVRGALRVVRHRGYDGLTLEAVAKAAGQPRSATTYYFGEKRGLVLVMLETVLHDGCRADARSFAAVAQALDIPGAVFKMLDDILTDSSSSRVFFDLLPVVLRDPELLQRQVAFDVWLRDNLGAVLARAGRAAVAERATALATLLLAALDGLALQALLDPRGFDPGPSLAVFERLVARWSYGGSADTSTG